MIIAIDGLGVNGKTTLAKKIAEKLNFKNFGAGAIYRCIALMMIENNLEIIDLLEQEPNEDIYQEIIENTKRIEKIYKRKEA